MKQTAPKLNIYIKTHKENEPIRPVINNTQAPSYKTAKYLNKKIRHLICLPHTYSTKKLTRNSRTKRHTNQRTHESNYP